MDKIGVLDTQSDPSDPNGPKQTLRPHQTSENSLARWFVDLLAWGGGVKKKRPLFSRTGDF